MSDIKKNGIDGFEDMMSRLRVIADTMENSDVPLSESLKLFEEGMNLGKECRGILNNVELRVNDIKEHAKKVGVDSESLNTHKSLNDLSSTQRTGLNPRHDLGNDDLDAMGINPPF